MKTRNHGVFWESGFRPLIANKGSLTGLTISSEIAPCFGYENVMGALVSRGTSQISVQKFAGVGNNDGKLW